MPTTCACACACVWVWTQCLLRIELSCGRHRSHWQKSPIYRRIDLHTVISREEAHIHMQTAPQRMKRAQANETRGPQHFTRALFVVDVGLLKFEKGWKGMKRDEKRWKEMKRALLCCQRGIIRALLHQKSLRGSAPASNVKRDLYLPQKRPTSTTKEPYTETYGHICSNVCAVAFQPPVSRETYKRDLQLPQKRPTSTTNESYTQTYRHICIPASGVERDVQKTLIYKDTDI